MHYTSLTSLLSLCPSFFFNITATTEIYTLSLHDALPICNAAGKPLSMCGEMAASPIEAMVLIALGFRTLSLAATAIGPVKAMTRSLDAGALAHYLDELGERPDHSLRRWLEAYARDHAIAV